MRRILTTKRALRLLGDFAGDLVPGLDVVADVATIADLTALAEDLAAEVAASKAALEFAERGPQTLRSLMVDTEDVSFSSDSAFLKMDVKNDIGLSNKRGSYNDDVRDGR